MTLKVNKPAEELKDDTAVVEQVSAAEAEPDATAEAVEVEPAEAEPAAEAPAPTETKAVATYKENLPAQEGLTQGLQAMLEDLRKNGFEGVGLEFGTFPLLSLDKGEFKINDKEIGKAVFQVTPLSSVKKYCYRNEAKTAPLNDKDKEQVWEESEGAHLEPGSQAAMRIAEWAEKGWTYSVSEYVNVLVHVFQMPAAPEYENAWVMLSIPPTSKRAYSAAALKCKTNGYDPHECLLEVSVGEKIKGNRGDWYPWNFAAKGSLKKFGLKLSFGVKNEDF